MKEQSEIPFNRKKIIPHLLGALVFVVLGIWMITMAFYAKNQLFGQVVFFLVGLSSVSFFGLIFIMLFAKIIKSKAGIIINDEGLTDNAGGLPVGLIAWGDIKKVNFTLTGNNTTLVIILKRPEKYIERESNFLKRWAMRMNYKMSGSPVHIPANYLDIDLNTLNVMIAEKRFRKKPTAGQE